jgi:hypothetical protein
MNAPARSSHIRRRSRINDSLAASAWIPSSSRAIPSLAKTAALSAPRPSKVNANREMLSNCMNATLRTAKRLQEIYFVACCNDAGSSSRIHSTTEIGRLPFLIRSS